MSISIINDMFTFKSEKREDVQKKIDNEYSINRCSGQVAAYMYLNTHRRKLSAWSAYQINAMIILCGIITMGIFIFK